MTPRKRFIPRMLIIIVLLSLAATAARADDKSFSSVVKHMKSNYKAKQQGFFGMMMLARFAVKLVKPAGVKNFKVAMLRNLDYSKAPTPDRAEFHAAIRGKINSMWEPLLQYSAPREKQWSYAYVTREKEDVKMLIVAIQREEAFVVQFKFSPDKLVAFINDPKVMGISLKGDDRHGNRPNAEDANAEDDEDEETPKPKPPEVKPPR
jgi:hypothetical protein